jgi:hypothetical protein
VACSCPTIMFSLASYVALPKTRAIWLCQVHALQELILPMNSSATRSANVGLLAKLLL